MIQSGSGRMCKRQLLIGYSKAMTAVPGLRYQNPEKDMAVQSGASDTGLGAVLMQGGRRLLMQAEH